ncbi:Nif3-like dinuclear metal center hexameric protein [Thermosediminibacter litoriperuensis]|uniref:GTP cyclohydrolase 1 type 2 homolog n=1 Tax=Thermosediminibacter litoriperuensis TaxID=291989 RepID=A0A5S5AH12_9FIRM|nr:Nif3-like dinuclear metal center hexameric protein [Thermosediminibacter litoriperuensis]TYP49267.1 NIF3 (NGG1p interacting factor 3) protein [Thermosediminibacter litoriperuensis]
MQVKVKDVLKALDDITGGRVVMETGDVFAGRNPFVVIKSSNIPGKSVMEIPGLVFGDPEAVVSKIAVVMTLTESCIELAAATGVDLIVAHHPVADAANSGGVTLKNYLGLYGINVIELHEAFHGLHPGISYIHGHRAFRVDIRYGGIPGNILYVGKVLDGVKTLGDMLDRLNKMMDMDREFRLSEYEKSVYGCEDIKNSVTAVGGEILIGAPETEVKTVLHIFPHTGFTPEHLEMAKMEHPEADTVLATISRVRKDSALVAKARELGLNFICGNCHSMEVFENGLPLAHAIRSYLPKEIKIVVFRERVISIPVERFGSSTIQEYAGFITENYLMKKGG